MTTIGLQSTAAVDALDLAGSVPRMHRAVAAAAVTALVAVDLGIVTASFLTAHLVRVALSDTVVDALSFSQYFRTALVVGCIAAFLLVLQGLTDLDRARSWPTRLRMIVSAISTALVVGVLVTFDQDQRLSRAWLAAGWSLAIVGLATWRTVAPSIQLAIHRKMETRPRLIVVGANAAGQELARELETRYEVLGYVDNGVDLEGPLDRPLLSPIADLERLVRSRSVDEIVIALPPDRRDQVDRIVARGFGREVEVKLVAELSQLPQRLEIGRFGARSYIGFAPVARVSWVKRAVDLALTLIVLVVALPLVLIVAVAVKLESPGAVLYRQRRVGKDGVEFDMLKFRSMCQDAEQLLTLLQDRNEATGPLFKIKRDPRVTRVGRVLRRFSLDELPQLFNVLRGEMSLVGPRPPIPAEVLKYEEWQLARLRAVPGMTGLWQVSGRSEVPFTDMVRLDLHYVRNWSFGLDLEILLRTIPAVLANRGAY